MRIAASFAFLTLLGALFPTVASAAAPAAATGGSDFVTALVIAGGGALVIMLIMVAVPAARRGSGSSAPASAAPQVTVFRARPIRDSELEAAPSEPVAVETAAPATTVEAEDPLAAEDPPAGADAQELERLVIPAPLPSSRFETPVTEPVPPVAAPQAQTIPVEAEVVVPVETDATPIETDATPIETDAVPAEADVTPVEAEAAPVEAEAAPVEALAAPVEALAAPVQAEALPDQAEVAPEPIQAEAAPEPVHPEPVSAPTVSEPIASDPISSDPTPAEPGLTPAEERSAVAVADHSPFATITPLRPAPSQAAPDLLSTLSPAAVLGAAFDPERLRASMRAEPAAPPENAADTDVQGLLRDHSLAVPAAACVIVGATIYLMRARRRRR